jgi:RNA 2',3'-cyclic 3'-phosphodiesterase
MHRLFVGIRPPAPIRELLIDLMDEVPGARWQEDEQLHITLRFIGEVATPMADDVVAALATLESPAFTLRLDGVGRFERGTGVRALWAGIRPHEPLAALHRKTDHALVGVGLASERRAYLPHITIARLSGGRASTAAFLARHAGLSSPGFTVEHMILFESHLTPQGAYYEAIARWPLSGSTVASA